MSDIGGVATQPLSPVAASSFAPTSPPAADSIWGWLVPSVASLPPLPLKCSSYKLGRNDHEVDLVLEKIQKGAASKASRVHFTLTLNKKAGTVSLEDESMNGTWVGGRRVGNGEVCSLQHCQDIALVSSDWKVFTLLLSDALKRSFPEELTKAYLVGEKVGSGTTAEVRLCYRHPCLSRFAVKLVNKSGEWDSKYSMPCDFRREVDVIENVDHPCAIKVEEVIETDSLLAIVMEFAAGGELFDQVMKDEKAKLLQEDTAKFQFFQVVDCVRHLHSLSICHRDLKLENLLLAEEGSHSLIKVTDFGLAKIWGSGEVLETYVGTPVYMAPEVVACAGDNTSSYSSKSDCWSLGVILYLLLSGRHPFPSNVSEAERDQKIKEGRVKVMVGCRWQHISSQAKALVRALLEVDPEKRLSCEETLAHPWFTDSPDIVEAAVRLMKEGLKVDRKRRETVLKAED